MDVITSTRRPTNINKSAVAAFQCIMTPSFVTHDMFDIIVPYLFTVWFFMNNDDCLGQQISTMIPFMPIRLYKKALYE